MQEYGGEAIVLQREPQSECDSRVALFTRRFGKIVAKAKSARKITSKLASHLEPGNVADVRIVEKNDAHITDALKKSRVDATPADLHLLNVLLAEAQPDQELWRVLVAGEKFSWEMVLKVLGWDPREAQCETCGAPPDIFRISQQDFFCYSCAKGVGADDMVAFYLSPRRA